MVTYTAHTKEHGSLLSQSTLESATFDSVRWVTDVLGRQRRLQSISELLSSKPRFFTILWRFYVSTVGVYPQLRDSSTGMPNRPSTKLCKYRRGPFHQTLPRQSSITCMALAIYYCTTGTPSPGTVSPHASDHSPCPIANFTAHKVRCSLLPARSTPQTAEGRETVSWVLRCRASEVEGCCFAPGRTQACLHPRHVVQVLQWHQTSKCYQDPSDTQGKICWQGFVANAASRALTCHVLEI